MDRMSPKKTTTAVSLLVRGEDNVTSPGSRTRSSSTSSTSKHGKARKTNSLPLETVEYLKAWMMSPEHVAHPYPTEQEKAKIMQDTGIELKQLTNWFVNNRKRYWKPRVEGKIHEAASTVTPSALPQQQQPQLLPAVVTPRKQVEATSLPFNTFSLGSAIVAGLLNSKPMISPSSSSSSLSNSPARVSDHSISSETDSVCSTDDEMMMSAAPVVTPPPTKAVGSAESASNDSLLAQTEYVNVHILRPLHGNTPSIDDVTILHNVPADRVLQTYRDCPLTYKVPTHALSDIQTIQSCRESEICKLKIRYLNQFLSAPLTPKRTRQVVTEAKKTPLKIDDTIEADENDYGDDDDCEADEATIDFTPRRRKFRRVSLETWREACTTSRNFYDHRELPSLEEAATLFGFANS